MICHSFGIELLFLIKHPRRCMFLFFSQVKEIRSLRCESAPPVSSRIWSMRLIWDFKTCVWAESSSEDGRHVYGGKEGGMVTTHINFVMRFRHCACVSVVMSDVGCEMRHTLGLGWGVLCVLCSRTQPLSVNRCPDDGAPHIHTHTPRPRRHEEIATSVSEGNVHKLVGGDGQKQDFTPRWSKLQ